MLFRQLLRAKLANLFRPEMRSEVLRLHLPRDQREKEKDLGLLGGNSEIYFYLFSLFFHARFQARIRSGLSCRRSQSPRTS